MSLMFCRIHETETIFWKIAIIILGIVSLLTGIIKPSELWTSYLLDITGPAWIYILIRGQYKSQKATFLTIKFSPELALFLIVGICFAIETMQLLKLYESTFDPWDYLAYFSGTFLIYLIDTQINKKGKILTRLKH